jgi:hypothetical protein
VNIKALIASIVLGVATISPVQAQGTHEEHERLWETIQSIGITTVLNEPTQCSRNISGAYGSRAGLLIICQDNAKTPYSQVSWTQNDYDTLRHEAHHIVQDCADNTLGDSNLIPIFNENELEEFVSRTLSDEAVNKIIREYRSHGVGDEVLIAEIEAFAVARSVGAGAIADKIIEFCTK